MIILGSIGERGKKKKKNQCDKNSVYVCVFNNSNKKKIYEPE